MALTKVTTGGITDATIATADIAPEAVELQHLPHGTSSTDGKFLRANNGADPTFETVSTDLVADTSPQLGGNLDTNGSDIVIDGDDRLDFGSSGSTHAKLKRKTAATDAVSGGLTGHVVQNSLVLDSDQDIWLQSGGKKITFGTSDSATHEVARIQCAAVGSSQHGFVNLNYVTANAGGSASSATKLATTATGVTVTGDITVSGTVDGIDIATDVAANTAKVTNATHTGEVTGATALTIADNVVDEANLKVSNSPTNGYFLSAQSGNTGGLTWAEAGGGGFEPGAGTMSSNVFGGTGAGGAVVAGGGYFNVMVGRDAGRLLSSGDKNVFIGDRAGYSYTTGDESVVIGSDAGYALTTADENVLIGYEAGYALTTGDGNTIVGRNSGKALTTGYENVYVGKNCGTQETTGYSNIGIGQSACTGGSGAAGNNNTGIGYNTLDSYTSGSFNICLGYDTGKDITTGNRNIILGTDAGEAITTGSNNIFLGSETGSAMTTGAGNVAIGREAFDTCTTGTNNTSIGRDSGTTVTTGYNNVFVGYNNRGVTDGQANTYLGANLSSSNSNNFCRIYQGNIIASYGPSDSGWSFSSDGRDKTDIVDLTLGLDFINKIRPRKFRWDFRDPERFPIDAKDNPDVLIRSGFIAQEVQEVLDEEGVTYTSIVNDKDPDKLEVSQTRFIPMMINAIQELSAEVKALKAAAA